MADLDALERRIAALEQEVDGEKVVSRYILEQTRRNGDDLAAVRSRLDRVESRLDRVESRLNRLETEVQSLRQEVGSLRQEVGSLRHELRSLRTDLPHIIAETMREVLRLSPQAPAGGAWLWRGRAPSPRAAT